VRAPNHYTTYAVFWQFEEFSSLFSIYSNSGHVRPIIIENNTPKDAFRPNLHIQNKIFHRILKKYKATYSSFCHLQKVIFLVAWIS
jgi:hypothetical protein